jgi:hypothetical protein
LCVAALKTWPRRAEDRRAPAAIEHLRADGGLWG